VKKQHGAVHVNFPRPRREPRGKTNQQVQSTPGNQQAQPAANQRQQETLCQQLAEHPHASRAQSSAHRELPLSPHHPREIQVRNIRTGDQENEARCRQQHQHRGTSVVRKRLLERCRFHGIVISLGIVFRVGLLQIRRDSTQSACAWLTLIPAFIRPKTCTMRACRLAMVACRERNGHAVVGMP